MSTTTTTMTDINGITHLKCAPVQCKPWCSPGDGHPDTWHREDQQCVSESSEVNLSLMPKVGMTDGHMWPSTARLMLFAPVDDAPMHVEVSFETVEGQSGWVTMTLEEAHDHALHVLMLVAQAQGKMTA
jgi:hypothetical protein